jgi:lantibiotic modifying enzyme
MHKNELHIFNIDSLKLENIIAHKANPVLIDCRKARNGGMIFKYEDEYYRPSQINIHGIYGRGLQISKIKKLTIEDYEEESAIAIEPNFKKGLIGIHHLHQLSEEFIFDARYKRF